MMMKNVRLWCSVVEKCYTGVGGYLLGYLKASLLFYFHIYTNKECYLVNIETTNTWRFHRFFPSSSVFSILFTGVCSMGKLKRSKIHQLTRVETSIHP